jgi:hypothetical protein
VELRALLQLARTSRLRIAAATDGARSGAVQHWQTEWDTDMATLATLEARLAASRADYSGLSEAELESGLTALDGLTLAARRMRDKYRDSFAADERRREEIRARH